mgnify:CR=1 FL=1
MEELFLKLQGERYPVDVLAVSDTPESSKSTVSAGSALGWAGGMSGAGLVFFFLFKKTAASAIISTRTAAPAPISTRGLFSSRKEPGWAGSGSGSGSGSYAPGRPAGGGPSWLQQDEGEWRGGCRKLSAALERRPPQIEAGDALRGNHGQRQRRAGASAGDLVDPQEIERLLRATPRVSDAADGLVQAALRHSGVQHRDLILQERRTAQQLCEYLSYARRCAPPEEAPVYDRLIGEAGRLSAYFRAIVVAQHLIRVQLQLRVIMVNRLQLGNLAVQRGELLLVIPLKR